MAKEKGRRLIAQNRKARHDYSISDVYEAGVSLVGTEVKSLREGRASLVDGYAIVEDGEVWLKNVHIPEYDPGTWTNHEPRRSRKLLLHGAEISRLAAATREKGITIVPLSMYFKDGRVKVEIGVAVGRKSYDKRQALAQRDAEREARAAVGRRSKGFQD
ncbi:MAG: SsrA-binding protein SmpB [Actinomycetales bacterium]|nr:SsrA-binding protein SmpB [Actinomycetales bacterium]